MGLLILKVFRKINNINGIEWALLNADTSSNTKDFADEARF